MTVAREITAEELFAVSRDPFVRHQVDPGTVERVWAYGDAVVVQGGRHRSWNVNPGRPLTCLGPADDLVWLMHAVDGALDGRPGRVTMERDAATGAPATWRFERRRVWDWMCTSTPPAGVPRFEVVDVSEESRADEIDAVLDAGNPDSFARPGGPGIETWLGVRDDGGTGTLLGVGALERMADGTGHLRGVTVLPSAAGRGVGSALSHGLTVRGLANGSSGMVTLGVYADNAPALAIYRRLGYTTVHRFCSGTVVDGGT